MVCNRSQSNLGAQLAERNTMEDSFFSEKPWSAITSDRRGIIALKRRLDGLLVDLARKTFQEVACDISEAMDGCTERLQNLGPQRCDKMEQQTHLLRIATTFQSLTSHALDAYYGREPCFNSRDDLRLATTIKGLQDDYSSILRRKGPTRHDRRKKGIATAHDKGDPGDVLTPQGDESSEDDSTDSSSVGESSNSSPKSPLEPEAPIELKRILFQIKRPRDPPHETIIPWIRREYHRSKGFEIGTFNPSLLPALYHEQIKNWRYYTLDHMNKVLKAIHSFIRQLLEFVCSDHQICERIWAVLSPHVVDSYKRALEHVTLLLQVEEAGNMRTLNHYFTLTLNKLRLQRVTKRLASAKSWTATSEGNEPLIRLTDALDAHKSNDDQLIEDLDDILRSYYKLAQKQFVDAVSKGAVDYLLLTVADGPLRVFSPAFVGSLVDEQLSHIAGESPESARVRSEIIGELQVLKEGHAVVNG